jgi:hypothetical protein
VSWIELVVEAGLVCSPRVEADDNWNMTVYNKKAIHVF